MLRILLARPRHGDATTEWNANEFRRGLQPLKKSHGKDHHGKIERYTSVARQRQSGCEKCTGYRGLPLNICST
jgi:hypothetical protein